jgi:hypothetical protein
MEDRYTAALGTGGILAGYSDPFDDPLYEFVLERLQQQAELYDCPLSGGGLNDSLAL